MAKAGTKALDLPYSCNIKVHRSICSELQNFIDRISEVLPAIESSRPKCSLGIQALCSLHVALDKAKLLIQHCSESSKLYLAITADKILFEMQKNTKCVGVVFESNSEHGPIVVGCKGRRLKTFCRYLDYYTILGKWNFPWNMPKMRLGNYYLPCFRRTSILQIPQTTSNLRLFIMWP
ncbi:RING-type E3 ubiquitin transferase [Quillaja saponaria]|uniref:RING-type E3 ubiquitin transferase n=1 Tax=Quillaja saponaria TaxID=32244 RepID=A0AAD7PTP8_QUISA|nr:RING-type E3 ubiquitin transferase [Quillaja saponaria]